MLWTTLLLHATSASAQRAGDNAVTAADDAFGSSIGRESIGLYTASSVRGFSANAAGNTRIDGLYFDPVWAPSGRIRRSSAIRVGLSAQGFTFPAPTGIVDYTLRRPGAQSSASAFSSLDTMGSVVFELDGEVPLGETLSIGAGLGLYRNAFPNGTAGRQHVEGLIALWRPTPALEVQPFWTRSSIDDDEFGPVYIPAGAFLPPRIERGRFRGPDEPKYRGTAVFQGATASYALADGWQLRGSLVDTYFDDTRVASHLLVDLTPEGTGRRLFIVDPPVFTGSTSGEARLTRRFTEGPRVHALHANVRARDRDERYGGSQFIDLGATTIDADVPTLGEDFTFSAQTSGRVRQWTGGLAWEARWHEVGEISLGVQRTDYEKRVEQPDLAPATTRSEPWLYNAAAAWYADESIAVYAGYTRGLEESGVAPENAVNRNEPLPAILTEQRDAGLRWTLPSGVKLVAGVFDVRKPYFQLDEANRYTQLGDVQHRGIEASVSGALSPRLDIVAGGVFMRPRVTGEGVELGRVGERPVGQPERNLQLNLDWRPPGIEGLSLDLGASYLSARPATRDNLVDLPPRTLVDLGARYRFRHAGHDISVRGLVSNMFDVYGYDLRGSGAYDVIAGRVALVSVAVDF